MNQKAMNKTAKNIKKQAPSRAIAVLAAALSAASAAFFLAPSAALASTISVPTNFLSQNTGLVGWWTFDGPNMVQNVADSSGQGNNGYLVGFTSTSSAIVPGKIGQALQFNGVTNYVNLGSNISSLNIIGNLTYSAWIKTADTNADIIYDGYDAGVGNSGTGLAINITANKVCFWNSAYGNWACSNSNVNNNKWHLVTVSLSGVNAIFYIDGQFDSQVSNTSPVSYTGNRNIGVNSSANSFFYKGSLDDVRVYNRALSASEVQQLYNMGK